jgi:hypothetical protein
VVVVGAAVAGMLAGTELAGAWVVAAGAAVPVVLVLPLRLTAGGTVVSLQH